MAISGTFFYINSVGGVILNIKHQIKELVMINLIGALFILGLSYFLISKELSGIGIAWLIGQGAIAVMYIYFIKKLL